MGIGVELASVDIVFYLPVSGDYVGILSHTVVVDEMCRSIVQRTSVGGPPGVDLHFMRFGTDGAHLVLLHIVEDEVAPAVKHLYFAQVLRMERLPGYVGGVGYQFLCGVPGRIHTGTDGFRSLQVHFARCAVGYNHGSAESLTHVELHIAYLRDIYIPH